MEKKEGICEPDYYDFLETAWNLSDVQLTKALDFMQEILSRRRTYGTSERMAESLLGTKMTCPKGHVLVKNGKTRSGIQRYYCRTCRKSFAPSDLSLYGGTKLSEKDWERCHQLICGDMTLDKLSSVCNININAAWFLRQRIMQSPENIRDGVVFQSDVWIDELYKVHRRTDEKKRDISSQQTPVFVVGDCSGNILCLTGPRNGKRLLMPHIKGEDITITTDQNSCYSFLSRMGYRYVAIKADPESEEYEKAMEPINNVCSSLRNELGKHNGISYYYLQRYLNLFWFQYTYARKGVNTEKLPLYLRNLIWLGSRVKRKELWKGKECRTEAKKKRRDQDPDRAKKC